MNVSDVVYLRETHHFRTSIDVAIHVDSGLLTTNTLPRLDSLLVALEDKFKIIKITEGIRQEYLSMVLDFNKDSRSVSMSMPKYASKIFDESKQIQDSPKLTTVDQKLFHSTVVYILF